MKTIEELNDLIDRMAGAMVWASGAEEFGPEGRAHAGFIDFYRPILFEALEYIVEVMPREPVEDGVLINDPDKWSASGVD